LPVNVPCPAPEEVNEASFNLHRQQHNHSFGILNKIYVFPIAGQAMIPTCRQTDRHTVRSYESPRFL